MGNYNVGDMIRLSRIAKKMTQEELSEGVCSVETLSRIENGKHKVKSDTYRQLMEKMYQITEKNYAVCVSRDMELIEEREYFEDAMAKHDFEKADFYMEQMKKWQKRAKSPLKNVHEFKKSPLENVHSIKSNTS